MTSSEERINYKVILPFAKGAVNKMPPIKYPLPAITETDKSHASMELPKAVLKNYLFGF